MPSKIAICYSIRSVFHLEHEILWMSLFLHAGGYILLLITWMHTICSNVIIKNCATKFSTVHVHLMCQLILRLCNDNIISVWGPVISLWSMFSFPWLTCYIHFYGWWCKVGCIVIIFIMDSLSLGSTPKGCSILVIIFTAIWYLLMDSLLLNSVFCSITHSKLPLSLLLQQYFTQFLVVSALEHLYKIYVCDVTDVIMASGRLWLYFL